MTKEEVVKQLKAGKSIEVKDHYWLTATYLPKSNTVITDCEVGCCHDSHTLEDFLEMYYDGESNEG